MGKSTRLCSNQAHSYRLFYSYIFFMMLGAIFSTQSIADEAPNLISNGGFDDASGWTVVSQYGPDVDGNGVVTIENGTATFSETVAGSWTKHMGIYTSVQLEPGIYQFDMDMDYADINELWGEVYIGKSEPQANSEYSGDHQVIKAYNSWDCSSIITYSGKASESGCDSSANPGQFTISESGIYYLLFRSGANTYGSKGVILDNWTLFNVSDTFAPIISLKGAETISVYLNSIYTDLGAITDSGEEVVIDSSAVDTSKAGTYIVTYNATDSDDNDATQITRTVNVESSYVENVSLLTNGSFDDSTGWTVVNQYGTDVDGNGVVTINDGKVTFSETVAGPWTKHMGIYTSVQLASGKYQFDMHLDYADIDGLWGEVYVGKDEPQANSEYFGDQRVLRAFDTSSCPSVTKYSGKAIASGCDSAATPGQFAISEPGTYYLLFRSGANTYGTKGIILDDWTVSKVIAGEDTVAPIITLTGGDSISIYLNSTYNDLGATSDTGEEVIVDSSAVDTSKIGSYTVTYDVTDASDNVATQITRTVNVIEPGTAVVADFSEAFGGAIYDASTDTFTWPANAEEWAGFANQNTALYPFRFPNGGELTFTGAVPSGGGDVSVRFKFERLPHPNVEPAFDTSSVTITGEAESSYSIAIPAQDGANTYSSLIFYLNDQNSAAVIKNVRITSAEGGSSTGDSTGDSSDSENSRFAIWKPFDGTTQDENTFMWPASAQNWAGFENTNNSIIPITFTDGGSVTFTGSIPPGGENVSVGFTFETQAWPNTEPQFDSENVTVSGESETTYTINIPARPSDETYSSVILKIRDRDQSVIIKDVQFISNDDLDSNGEASGSYEGALNASGLVYHWKSQSLLEQVSIGISSGADSTVTQQSVSNNLGEFDLTITQQGSNTLTANKPISNNESGSVISSADALAALKIAVGINPNQDPDGSGPSTTPPVSPYQYIAADITGDGRVTSADALAILKMAVNLDSAEPRRWAFIAENYDFWDEAANSGTGQFKTNSSSVVWDSLGANFDFPQQSNVNIVGVLLGDVNGSWSAPEGSSTLSPDHLVNLVDNQGGSLAQWGLSDSEDISDSSDVGSGDSDSGSGDSGDSGGSSDAVSYTLYSQIADGMIEARGAQLTDTPGAANGEPGSATTFQLTDMDSWKYQVGEFNNSDSEYGMGVGLMVFQLPNLGAVSNPFDTASLAVLLNQRGTSTDFDTDLWAVRSSASPTLALSDWYIGPAGTAPTEAGTIIQESFLTLSTPTGNTTYVPTSASGDKALADYLNSVYDGGNGAGLYVIFRMNKGFEDSYSVGWNAYEVLSSQAGGGESEAPKITYTSTNAPSAPVTSAPTPNANSAFVVSVFSDAYTDLADTNFNPNWGQTTAVSTETIDGGSVLKYSGLNYQGTNLGGAEGFEQDLSTYETVHVDYWTADATELKLSVISTGPAETPYTFAVETGKWTGVDIPVSTFTDVVDMTKVFQLKFEGNGTVFLDNIYFERSAPTAPSTSAPTPSADTSNVISVFSDAYTDLADTNFNPNWGQATAVGTETIDGGSVLKYSGLNYQGTNLGGADGVDQDVSSYKSVHVDFWTADSTEIKFFLISRGEETSYSLPVETQKWVSVDIPLTEFSSVVDLTEVFQFKVEGDGTVFLDNLYFEKEDEIPVVQEIDVYVRDIGFSSPYYLFSDTANGASKTLTLQRGSTYKFIAAGVRSSHPFNISGNYSVSDGWRRVDPAINLSSTSTRDVAVDRFTKLEGVGSIVTGQSITLTVPIEYTGDSVAYYCYAHSSMVESFPVVDP